MWSSIKHLKLAQLCFSIRQGYAWKSETILAHFKVSWLHECELKQQSPPRKIKTNTMSQKWPIIHKISSSKQAHLIISRPCGSVPAADRLRGFMWETVQINRRLRWGELRFTLRCIWKTFLGYTLISKARLITWHINVLLRSILSPPPSLQCLVGMSGAVSVLYQISCGWDLEPCSLHQCAAPQMDLPSVARCTEWDWAF